MTQAGIGSLELDEDPERALQAGLLRYGGDQPHVSADPVADRHRCREASIVDAIVDGAGPGEDMLAETADALRRGLVKHPGHRHVRSGTAGGLGERVGRLLVSRRRDQILPVSSLVKSQLSKT